MNKYTKKEILKTKQRKAYTKKPREKETGAERSRQRNRETVGREGRGGGEEGAESKNEEKWRFRATKRSRALPRK